MRALLIALTLSTAVLASEDAASAWTLSQTSTVKVKKGGQGTAKVEVVPRSDAHVSPDAPISLALTPPPGVKVEKTKLGRPDAKETQKKGVEFDVPFTADQSGELKGKLTFFICTEKLCERQTKDLAFAVQVE
jgi:hypothetical protein